MPDVDEPPVVVDDAPDVESPADPPEGQPDTPESEAAPEPEPEGRGALATLGDDDEIIIPTPIDGLPLIFTKDQKQLTPEQMRILAPLRIEADYDPGQVWMWLLDCRSRGFDPYARESFLYRIGKDLVRHVGIEGLRRKAQESGEYRGQTAPQFAGPDGVWKDVWTSPQPPLACRVGVYRAGFVEAVFRPVYWEEYCPMVDEYVWEDGPRGRRKRYTGNKVPSPMWRRADQGGKPLTMVSKCAEAAAMRAAWPNTFGGYYVPEETEKSRTDAAREAEAAHDAAAERRHAAYQKANPAAARIMVVDSTAEDTTPVQDVPQQLGALALAELEMQAEVLQRDVPWMVKKWVAARGGRDFSTASPAEVVEVVLSARPYVIEALRMAGRDAEADAYERAGTAIMSVGQLLGQEVNA